MRDPRRPGRAPGAPHDEAAGAASSTRHEPLRLKDAIDFTLAEARMVLPGVQAIFGFQLIVTFSERFSRDLDAWQQGLHMAALLLTGIAMALVMTPAAYHRHVQRESISHRLLDLASGFTSAGMVVLATGLALDVYVVALLITGAHGVSWVLAGGLFVLFMGLWVVYPRAARHGAP